MRVLVLEDERDLAAMVASALSRSGFAVDVCHTLEDGLAALPLTSYDALILDRSVPDGDAITILRSQRASGSIMPILFVTARESLEERVTCLNDGADDYIAKPFSTDELVARLRAVLRRSQSLSGGVLSEGNIEFDVISRSVRIANRPVTAARREIMLLDALLRRAGKVVTRESLDTMLFGFDDCSSPNALEASVSRLRKILAQGQSDRLIHTVRGVGYCLAP